MFNIHAREENMKRLLCGLMLAAAAGAAMADDLGDADKALRAKDYGRAFPLYARLADAGNAEAQFRLGEMVWYGDGTTVDMGKSRAWLQKAAAAGHLGARETLAVLDQRERRAADIAYWTTAYQGEDLLSGKYACAMPAIPAVSTQIGEIQEVGKAMSRWATCYNDFAADLRAAGPGSNRIPADLRKLMTPAELAQAVKRLDTVVAGVVKRREAEADEFTARRAAWLAATDKYLGEGRAEVVKIFMDREVDYIHRPDTGYLARRTGAPDRAFSGSRPVNNTPSPSTPSK